MSNRKYAIQASGTTQRERFYSIARRYCKIIAKREAKNERCKRCFEMRFIKRDRTTRPRFGCDGCAEMDGFYQECAALFVGVKINPIWRII